MLTQPLPTSHPPLRWDVFCRVIDNYGDIGVCWRLCADLAARGHSVRLWTDDGSALAWMAPGALDGLWPGVQVLDWERSTDTGFLRELTAADVWLEGFGCEIATEFIAAHALPTRASGKLSINQPVWINLEYLSAEGYVERSHGLASPVLSGPGKGKVRYFYYPGFTHQTGGLIREAGVLARMSAVKSDTARRKWLVDHGIAWHDECIVSLFCYEPAALETWLKETSKATRHTHLLITAGRASTEVQRLLASGQNPAPSATPLTMTFLPPLSQQEYDELLAVCDLNFVRGEDSLVRALWAGKPFVWQIYPQSDQAHHAKLEALLKTLGIPNSLKGLMRCWNDLPVRPTMQGLQQLPDPSWMEFAAALCIEQSAKADLVTQLVDFVHKKR